MEKEKEMHHVEVHTEQVRAGKRTYFFDIKATRSSDYFICITESKRKPKGGQHEGFTYEKHKIFLYKEDFDKFFIALSTSIKRAREEIMSQEGSKAVSNLSAYLEKNTKE